MHLGAEVIVEAIPHGEQPDWILRSAEKPQLQIENSAIEHKNVAIGIDRNLARASYLEIREHLVGIHVP